jgi:hypothetical protein
LSIDGNRVRLGGYSRIRDGYTVETQRILVEQLRGLNDNPDEPVVPVVWTEEPQVEAFYAVDSVTVDCDPDFWANGHFRWSASLTRITDGALPLLENTYALNGRGNDHSITLASSTPWISRSSRISHYYKGATGTGVGAGYISEEIERPANGVTIDTTLSTAAGIYTAQWSVGPAYWNEHAASVEVSYDSGSTYYPVVGRQFRYGYVPGSGDTASLIRVNTGRVSWRSIAADGGNFSVAVGSESATVLDCILSGAAPITVANMTGGMSILRNAPHIAAARFYTGRNNHHPARPAGYIDVAGRRGSHYLECHWADKESWIGGIRTQDGGGHTAITAGPRRTRTDGDGNRIVILTTKTKTNDTTSGGFTLTTPLNSLPFAVGFEVDGTGAQNGDRATDLVYQYFGAVTENVRLVTR